MQRLGREAKHHGAVSPDSQPAKVVKKIDGFWLRWTQEFGSFFRTTEPILTKCEIRHRGHKQIRGRPFELRVASHDRRKLFAGLIIATQLVKSQAQIIMEKSCLWREVYGFAKSSDCFFAQALTYATYLHARQTRKGSDLPYISHLLAVSSIEMDYGASENERRRTQIGSGVPLRVKEQGGSVGRKFCGPHVDAAPLVVGIHQAQDDFIKAKFKITTTNQARYIGSDFMENRR